MVELLLALIEFISNSSANIDVNIDFFFPVPSKKRAEKKESDKTEE